MTIVKLRPDRMEVWSGIREGDEQATWFVSRINPDGEAIVSDRETETEAMQDAAQWGVPIVVRR